MHLTSTEPHQPPGATGRLKSLFASAHGRRVHLGPLEPEQQINCAKTERGSGMVAPGVSEGKPLIATTSDRSPGVTSVDLDVMLAELQRLRSEMVTSGPTMHSNSAESDLPPLHDNPKTQFSA